MYEDKGPNEHTDELKRARDRERVEGRREQATSAKRANRRERAREASRGDRNKKEDNELDSMSPTLTRGLATDNRQHGAPLSSPPALRLKMRPLETPRPMTTTLRPQSHMSMVPLVLELEMRTSGGKARRRAAIEEKGTEGTKGRRGVGSDYVAPCDGGNGQVKRYGEGSAKSVEEERGWPKGAVV